MQEDRQRRSSIGVLVGRVLEGFLKKGEYRAPTECWCIPMRERRFKDKYVVLDVSQGAILYAKSRGQVKHFAKRIELSEIKRVEHLEHERPNHFRIYLKKSCQEKYSGREHFTWAAIDVQTAKQWVKYLEASSSLHCNVYSVGEDHVFPEKALGVEPETAICFSGGGARAHVSTLGQLRALHLMGMLNQKEIQYISSVSGSSWATCIYTFYQQGAENDDHLLGGKTRLNDLNMYTLSKDPPPLGSVATKDMWKLAESLFWSTSYDEWWETTVGQVYLEPFGLNRNIPFGHKAMEPWIQKCNKTGLMNDVYYARPDRPFWIANAAILGPSWAKSGDVVPVQFTPMYSGTPFLHKMHVHTKPKKHSLAAEILVGGGMVDTFAFGSEEPGETKERRRSSRRISLREGAKLAANASGQMVHSMFKFVENLLSPSGEHADNIKIMRIPIPERPLTLRHTVGISSHAPAFTFKNYALTARLNPKSLYWSPAVPSDTEQRPALEDAQGGSPSEAELRKSLERKRESAQAHEMDFADGGTLDNVGLLAMLQRKVKRIVVCVNSEIPIPLKPKSKRTPARKSLKKIRKRMSSKRFSVGKPEEEEEEQPWDDDGFIYEEEEEVYGEAVSFMPTYVDWPQASVLPLFGIEVPTKTEFGTFAHNQVFAKAKIVSLLEQLQRKKLNGEPCIAMDTYQVMRNDWWGIEGGFTVEILWYYLDKTRSFELQLPTETLHEVDKGLKGAFPRFPTYKTFGTKRGKWIEPSLSNEQVNLLSSLTEWSFLQSEDLIRNFLRGTLSS